MWEKRKEEMKGIIARVDEHKLRELVLNIIEREPGLIFDLCEAAGDGNGGDRPDPKTQTYPVPSWCKCNSYRAMPTDLKNKCCGCLPRNCIAARPQMDRIVLDLEVLAIGNRYYRDMLGRHSQRVEDNNKSISCP
ncbi:uncharacterized protein LOC132753813 isoform X2 [Ruditapes philippinarum]|uniref:uncharacterized protein LOC132753813 isoform X2 n=1 Tax=Ruditapes philippinarum TaxID=129788 RepID=UPI00295B07A8|nr:uncharacterized protein LOC132753813 isoform X2 [Ruditapes philippinarum]